MPEENRVVLRVKNLSYNYGKLDVWNNISFELSEGSITFLVGPNGAGKSTLLRCLAGWSVLHEGEIELCGKPFKNSDRALKSSITFIPDTPSFYDDLTAWEHIEFIMKAARRTDRLDSARQLLEEFALSDHATQLPSSYSRGMREKLALVIALALQPKVYLLDEPFGPLDPSASATLSNKLKEAASLGASVLMSCHHNVTGLVPTNVYYLAEKKLTEQDSNAYLDPKSLDRIQVCEANSFKEDGRGLS